ncbi:MAG: hypothetical protein ACXVH2_00795 [Methanobacterium sp.]
MKNELLKQWQKDVDDYGENAYLLWEVTNNDKEYYVGFRTQGSALCCANHDINLMRRMQSAELPFDLERAKSGDGVEVMTSDDKWIDVQNILFDENNVYARYSDTGMFAITNKSSHYYLRMKYPPKVKR